MYAFRDVTETSEGLSLPSEALKINGEYIENLITGYRTLSVAGREALSPEVTTYETGIRDGSTLKGKRYPARIIRITYQLIAASNEEFRAAYNKLASILDVTDAELIFNDETDKFFTGTPCLIGEVEPGRNSVVGEFEILCLDPFKYSVLEYEAVPDLGESTIFVDYNGTYKSFPTLQAEFHNEDEASEDGETVTALTGSGDCGYVAFFNENKKIIQLGDPEEADGENSIQPSQALVNQKFEKTTSWGSAAKSLWAVNSGIASSSAVVQTGSVGIAVADERRDNNTKDVSTQEILKVISIADQPHIHYKLVAKVYQRTASSVKIDVSVQTRLDNSQSYFGRGYCLKCVISVGGMARILTLKEKDDYWRGTTVHTASYTYNVSLGADAKTYSNVTFRAFRDDNTGGTAGALGEITCEAITVPAFVAAQVEGYYLKSTDYGSGTDWHGASITRRIPADASGEVGATNFTLSYSQKMSCNKEQSIGYLEYGAFQALLVSGSGTSRKIVAGVNIYKGTAGTTNANLRFYVNNTVVKTTSISLAYNNKLNRDWTSSVTKTGGTIIFMISGKRYTFKDASIADTAVNEITFTFTQFGTKRPLSYNGLYWAKFVKHNCNTWKDIPNKFSANDIVEANCSNGEITLNGSPEPALGALGNDWEEFYLMPGTNQIGFSYSEWVGAEYAPKFKVKYREVFL